MKITLEFKSGQKIVVDARLHGRGVGFPNEEPKNAGRHNCFHCVITGPNGATMETDWYDSEHNYNRGKTWFTKGDAMSVLYSVSLDSIYGRYTIEEFVAELGFNNENPVKVLSIYNACQKECVQWEKISCCLDEETIEEINNY